MNINFNVSEHHYFDGFHLQTTFENGCEVSIIPSERPNLYEIAVIFDDVFIDVLQKFDQTSEEVLRIADEVQNFSHDEIEILLSKDNLVPKSEQSFLNRAFQAQDPQEIM